jgi:hypothetical protein
MPWHEPRLTRVSGEPTVRKGQRKLNQGREFLPEGRDTAVDEFNFNAAILIDHLFRPLSTFYGIVRPICLAVFRCITPRLTRRLPGKGAAELQLFVVRE